MLIFLLTVVGISLSGVIMPGPVLATTVAHSRESRFAGVFIAIGHGIVEIPLMFLIYLGLSEYFQNTFVKVLVGLVGGIVLIYFGKDVFFPGKTPENLPTKTSTRRVVDSRRSAVSGAITSIANPYFLVWWMTIGTALVLRSAVFGFLGLALFAIVHLSCDFIWYILVSLGVHHSGKLWGHKAQVAMMSISRALLLGFGVWFVISSLRWALE